MMELCLLGKESYKNNKQIITNVQMITTRAFFVMTAQEYLELWSLNGDMRVVLILLNILYDGIDWKPRC